MTTMSTVGCGAIVPHSISERAYVICAMILGCGYWGFVLRRVTSIISYKNLSTIAYWARMDDIHAWIEHHQFPRKLRTADPDALPPKPVQEVRARRRGHHE